MQGTITIRLIGPGGPIERTYPHNTPVISKVEQDFRIAGMPISVELEFDPPVVVELMYGDQAA